MVRKGDAHHAMAAVKRALRDPLRRFAKRAGPHGARTHIVSFGKKSQMVRSDFSRAVPETLRDGRRSMVGWFGALDDWGENVALTRYGTSSTAAYPSTASVAGGWRRWQPGAIG